MSEATFTFRVDEDLKAAFTAAAKEEERTGAQLLRAFMRDYVRQRQAAADYEVYFRSKVERGLADIEAGRTHSSEEVEAEAEAWRRDMMRDLGDE